MGTVDLMREKKAKLLKWIPFFTMLAILIAGYTILIFQISKDKNREVCIEVDNAVDREETVGVEMHIVKSWDDKRKYGWDSSGAQYDGTIVNKSNYTLRDWRIVLLMPGKSHIDSSWNGTYTYEGNDIVYIPDDSIGMNVLPAHESNTFGMVMYSHGLMNIYRFQVIGYLDKQLTDYPLFYVMLCMTAVFLAMIIGNMVVVLRMRKLEQRRIMDEKIIIDTLQMLAKLIDAKDSYTNGHSDRVAEYAVLLAKEMHMKSDDIRFMRYMGLMHDCGKMGIPDSVLNKPDKLTPEEMDIIRSHTVLGGKIVENFTAMPGVRECALYHHERYDGKGYPEGLKGEKIPLLARIICVADSFDAMNSDRCYRKRLKKAVILEELKKNAGTQFDPQIAKLMVKLIEEGKVRCDE